MFSLILCTRGRTEELKRFLVSIVNQVGDIRCEIIVVDQNKDERLAPIIQTFEDRLRDQTHSLGDWFVSRKEFGFAVRAGSLHRFSRRRLRISQDTAKRRGPAVRLATGS